MCQDLPKWSWNAYHFCMYYIICQPPPISHGITHRIWQMAKINFPLLCLFFCAGQECVLMLACVMRFEHTRLSACTRGILCILGRRAYTYTYTRCVCGELMQIFASIRRDALPQRSDYRHWSDNFASRGVYLRYFTTRSRLYMWRRERSFDVSALLFTRERILTVTLIAGFVAALRDTGCNTFYLLESFDS
jgi:hypothetical protein